MFFLLVCKGVGYIQCAYNFTMYLVHQLCVILFVVETFSELFSKIVYSVQE